MLDYDAAMKADGTRVGGRQKAMGLYDPDTGVANYATADVLIEEREKRYGLRLSADGTKLLVRLNAPASRMWNRTELCLLEDAVQDLTTYNKTAAADGGAYGINPDPLLFSPGAAFIFDSQKPAEDKLGPHV